MEDVTTLGSLAALIPTVITVIVQYLRKKDTNQHGDAFIDMLRREAGTMERVAEVIPALQPYIDEANEIISEAEQVWDSAGFTAQDMKFIQYRYNAIQKQISRDLDKMRPLKKE